MKNILYFLLFILVITYSVAAEGEHIWCIVDESGMMIAKIAEEPSVGDEYICEKNQHYIIERVEAQIGYARLVGIINMPSLEWMESPDSLPVSSHEKRIAIYCTHSDESYQPSDGFYSTRNRGTIYQIAYSLSKELSQKGIDVSVADTLHHPHDAGAYRRSRQTAVELLRTYFPDCLLDIHRDGIPDPSSYAITIQGEKVSKIRILVGRGNQNYSVNKDFALMIKAVADHLYPGLIKDIYLGKGAFNQDLLPRSLFLECGTYTLEKSRVISSMPLLADVINRALYGSVISGSEKESALGTDIFVKDNPTDGNNRSLGNASKESGSGSPFLCILFLIGIVEITVLARRSVKKLD